jgi:hypothetical protein
MTLMPIEHQVTGFTGSVLGLHVGVLHMIIDGSKTIVMGTKHNGRKW